MSNRPTIYTVFPNEPSDSCFDMPQDFDTYEEAVEYGLEQFGCGNFTVESPIG